MARMALFQAKERQHGSAAILGMSRDSVGVVRYRGR
jgi:hypothetical protein